MIQQRLFDFSEDGKKEWESFKDQVKLRRLDRPMLALKEHYGIEAVPAEIKQLLARNGEELGRKEGMPFRYLSLTR
jgi:hypothetical protein